MSAVCTCPRDQLCQRCFDAALSWHSGVAAARGERWAESVGRRRPDLLDRPWPALEGRPLALAVDKVADLTRDVRVAEQLLIKLQAGARRAWARAQAARAI